MCAPVNKKEFELIRFHSFPPAVRGALSLVFLVIGVLPAPADSGVTVLETANLRYEVSDSGRNVALLDRSDGTDLLPEGSDTPMCTLQKNGATWESLSLDVRDGLWHVGFGDAGVTVVLRPATFDAYFTLEVVSVVGEGVDQLNFLYLPLGARGHSGRLGCTALAMNLQTNVPELPGPMAVPMASCYARFGLVGARAAFIAAPRDAVRETLQQVMLSSESLPHSPLGGPWALDAKINRGSYLIDTEGEVGESTVGGWIELAKNLGMKQVDFHTGKSMRFGDLRPNPERYPNGAGGVKAVVDQMHEAGLEAGLHTYAFFIAKDTPWVTPVPDRRLATAATFTLDTDVDATTNALSVAESTAAVSAITGFQIRNSVTLRIDDELVVFSAVNVEAPFGFTQCERGALGTTAAPHARGAEVVQLKECFGLFVPDGDSTLFTEVAARTAEVYNQAGFDMIYLDALDGADIVAGGLNGWYYAAKFVFELNARLERPALFEMSTITHHIWMLRSRLGAWDVPARGTQRLADIHALANESAARNFMPANLGWSGIFDWNAVQPERTFASDVEHLCARALAADHSLSLLVGFTPASWERSANVRRLGGIIQRYETLRLDGGLSANVLARLRTSREPFVVTQDSDGYWQARLRRESSQLVGDEASATWNFHNPHATQVPRIRIESLSGLEGAESPDEMLLANGTDAANLEKLPAAEGVGFSWETAPSPPGDTAPGLKLLETNESAPAHSSYGGVSKRFSPAINLYGRGLGLWVQGDASGAVLNIQLQSTEAAAGGRAEHYVDLDFSGWRYVALVEPESARLGEMGWPYSKRHEDWKGEVPFGEVLHDYILWVNYGQIEQINLWLNGVPTGGSTACVVGPIAALPIRDVELKRPVLALNGAALTFPVDLKSGEYLELDPAGAGTVYNAVGESTQHFAIAALPPLAEGENTLHLSMATGATSRARVTMTVLGPPEVE